MGLKSRVWIWIHPFLYREDDDFYIGKMMPKHGSFGVPHFQTPTQHWNRPIFDVELKAASCTTKHPDLSWTDYPLMQLDEKLRSHRHRNPSWGSVFTPKSDSIFQISQHFVQLCHLAENLNDFRMFYSNIILGPHFSCLLGVRFTHPTVDTYLFLTQLTYLLVINQLYPSKNPPQAQDRFWFAEDHCIFPLVDDLGYLLDIICLTFCCPPRANQNQSL